MTEELVVIPLRVTKEQRRKWRVIAGAEDKSVQQWILGQLNPVCIVPSVAPKTVQVASETQKVVQGGLSSAKPTKPAPEPYRYTPENCGWHNFQNGKCIKCGVAK